MKTRSRSRARLRLWLPHLKTLMSDCQTDLKSVVKLAKSTYANDKVQPTGNCTTLASGSLILRCAPYRVDGRRWNISSMSTQDLNKVA